jgi:acyl carrier protein
MGGNNLETEIISIVADVSGFEEEEIHPDTKLAEDLEIDSIKAIEITVAIEKRFKISVRDEDVPNITTVREAVDLVTNIINQPHDAKI